MSVGRGVWFKKRTTESCCQLDMSYLTSRYVMDWDYQTTISWKTNRGRHDSIGLDICPPKRIRLHYSTTNRTTRKTNQYRYFVYLDTTPCNYGGKRWWFICPECHRRCRILYKPSDEIYFACRICHNLTYESQQEGKTGWWALFSAVFNIPRWQDQLIRTRSQKKRARLLKKIGMINSGLQGIIDSDKKQKKHRRKR